MSRTKFMGIIHINFVFFCVVLCCESKPETGPSAAALAGQKNKKTKN